jgi:leucyl/phenylalanyl-tRNA--protein transferase
MLSSGRPPHPVGRSQSKIGDLESAIAMHASRLDPETLLSAYAQGVFPMADHDGTIRLYTADPRGVIPLDAFHVPHTLAQLVRRPPERGGFEVRINHDFEATMRGCMQNRPDGTWINRELIRAYVRLHDLGYAHSVETWRDGQLAGGLYGVSLGAAFFGESMFHHERDASKVALVHLVNRLRERKFELLDTQATTSHLRRFGCIDIPAREYLVRLRRAIQTPREFD